MKVGGLGMRNIKFILSPEQEMPLGDPDIDRGIFLNFIKPNVSHNCAGSVAASIIVYAYFSTVTLYVMHAEF